MKDLDLWQSFEYTAMRPGLERVTAFLEEAGNPQRSYKVVHIAGTNGKGSTAAMTARILESAGYRTGLYVSPHLLTLAERIQVNSKQISRPLLNTLGERYYKLAKKHSLTFFEFITALAFIYFKREKIDIAVLETGLGGRFDATNVVKDPIITVITGIDYDHTEILGKTLEAIAGEKAGIIKRGCAVVSGAQNRQAREIIRKISKRNGSVLLEINKDFFASVVETDWQKKWQAISYGDKNGKLQLRVPLLGEYQAINAAMAVAAARALNNEGFKISDKAVISGVGTVKWPGRFDVRHCKTGGVNKTAIVDGAHNPQAMRMFIDSFKKSIWAEKPFDVIFGVLKDKDYVKIAGEVQLLGAEHVIVVPIKSKRAIDTGSLTAVLEGAGLKKVYSCKTLKEALNKAGNTVVVTGSLYLAGEALKIIKG